MTKKAFRFTVLGLGLAGAGFLAACADTPETNDGATGDVTVGGARVTAAEAGQALMANAKAAPAALVREFLTARGEGRAAGQLKVTGAARGRGLTHLRLEQEVGGFRVHGAYVKAAVTDLGELVHVVDRLAPSERGVAPASVGASTALAAALARLGYDASDLGAASGTRGNVTRFARGATFHQDPSVERVAYVDDAGALREGFLVETWSARGNRLDHTLVGGAGEVISVEARTNTDSYNVFVEDPLKGAQTVVAGPGAGNAESPAGWLGAAAQTTINISGNNVRAYLDADANNAADPGGTAVSNGNFLTAVDLAAQPSTTGNKAVAVQNLFYLNNTVHDTLYRHGFNEAAGNFQANNFGQGGAGNDPVNAEAQDGSGTDNANFATPTDGSSPRMQMYLWSGRDPDGLVTVGGADSGAYGATFGPALTLAGTTAALALYNDGTGVATDGCERATTSLTGKIAIVDRGTCNFTDKVLNAQNAGAVAVIVANNVDGPAFAMGGTQKRIKIPSGMVSLADGNVLRAQLGASATLRKNPVPPLKVDGDLDSDIVFHEYGHGLTWRMIGGMSGPLAGAIGEGASDVTAFLIDGDDRIGEYAWGDAGGIRRQPYADYQGSYSDVDGGEVHNDGEIYAAAMYRVWQNYLQAGLSTDDMLDDFVDGMNFTPSTPAFENMRDGMLSSAAGSGRECLIWEGFAHFGIGVGAKGTASRRGAVTIVESFAMPSGCP